MTIRTGQHRVSPPPWSITSAQNTWTANQTFSSANILLGANKIIGTDLLLKETGSEWVVRNAADDAYGTLRVGNLRATGDIAVGGLLTLTGTLIKASNADDGFAAFQARDNGSGLVEIARMVGAADPYLQATLAFRLNPIATASLPGTPVEGMIAYDNTLNKLVVYNGAAWETVTSA